jgi:hypothetical protein
MDIGEPQRIWEVEPIDEPAAVPEEPIPADPRREQEPVPAK